MSSNETIADIVAEMRSPRPIKNWRGEVVGEIKPSYKVLEWSDRIEAAANREGGNATKRNCDIGTAQEQQKRFDMFTEKHWHMGKTALQWAQMPYEEGNAE